MKEEEERTPLRTILQNFLNHIEKLDREKLEGSYDKEFQELKLFSEFLKTSKQYSCSQGEKEVNRKKNRYKDILPFDCSRVILEDYAGIPGSDYINANYIKGASGSPAYIASQGPLPHTVNDFWRMVVQCEVQVIVMACNEEESGKHKCENYWVDREGEEKQFGMVAIQLIKASVVCPDFLVRTMRLKYTKNRSSIQEERTVCQFHYSAWPDHGVPPLVRPLLDMVRLVRDTQASETLPVLVHCSAGCGRTGTICAIDYVWGLLRAGKLTKDFSLFKLVREMRKQRIAMVQTKEQYILVHHAVKELFNEQLRMIDSHPYENIDVNGMVKESPEPVYATIKSDSNNEEKQDSNEKESGPKAESDSAPPLPCKRKPYTAHTKQEKEVENLTEKQRSSSSEQVPVSDCSTLGSALGSIPGSVQGSAPGSPGTSSSNSSTCGSLLHKPRIAKLRALFERTANRDSKSVQVKHRTPQQVTRSHSLGAVRKTEEGIMCIQPIPNRGVLRVPQLSVTSDATYVRTVRPALPIKRSKSLKVLSSGERNKFSVPVVQVGPPQESLHRESSSGAVGEFQLSSKISSLNANKSVLKEPKPYVPPKKVTKNSVSDRKVVKNVSARSRNCSPPSAAPLKKRSEDILFVNSPLSARESWRRSLDSLTLEEGGDPGILPTTSLTTSFTKETEPYRLDEEAKKLLEDCRDYLNVSEKSESNKTSSPGRKFQKSLMMNIDSLQHLTIEAQRKVSAVVGGLGTRERRNSFRQAISKEMESAAKPQKYETHLLVKPTSNPSGANKSMVQTPSTNGKSAIETSHLRMKVASKAVTPSSSGHVSSGPLHIIPLRSFRPNPRSHPKDVPSVAQYVPPVNAFSPSSVTPLVLQTEVPTTAGYSNVAENATSRWKSHTDSSSLTTNRNVQCTENVYLKGKIESVRQDVRLPVQNAINHQNKLNNSPCISAGHSRPLNVHGEIQSEMEIASNSLSTVVSHDGCNHKNVNVPVARRRTTVSKGRLMSPSANNTKLFELANASDSEMPIVNRAGYPEVRLPKNLIVDHEASHLSSIVNEQISINQEALGGIKNSKLSESHVLPSKSLSSTTKYNAPAGSNWGKERLEASAVAVGTTSLWQPEWSRQGSGGVALRLPAQQHLWPPPTQEQRFQSRAEAEASAEQSTTASRDIPAAERGLAAGRMVPKATVKLKKDTVTSEGSLPYHHGSQDDLALCASGSGGSAGTSRVRRHASVVLLRNSLIDNDLTPLAPLTVWNEPELGESNTDASNRQNVSRQDMEAWNVAPGVDVDMVGASIKPSRDHGTALTRALEAFHLRKPSRGAAVSPPQQRKFPQAQQVFVKKQHYL